MSVHISFKTNQEKALACLDFWGGLARAQSDQDAATKRITTEAPAFLKDEKWGPLLTLLIETSGVLWKLASPKEIETCMTLLITLTNEQIPADQQSDIVLALANSIVSGQSEKDVKSLKLKLLVSCFNYFPEKQYQVLTAMLKMTVGWGGDAGARVVTLDELTAYLEEWKSTPSEQFALLKLYCDNLKAGESQLPALKRALASFSSVGDVPAEALAVAQQLVSSSINLPHVYVFDGLLRLAPVAALQNSAEHKGAYQLLTVFIDGNLEDYKKLKGASSGLIDSLGLDEKRVEDKIRLLTLVDVCSNKTLLSYEDGAKAIGVETTKEFARWCIRAISESVIQGRLDELRQSLKLSGTIDRTFKEQQWSQLQSHLESFLVALDATTSLEEAQK